MSILWSNADAVSSGSCPILFKVLTLNVAICIVRLHFSKFYFSLSSGNDFFEHWGQGSNLSLTHPFFTRAKSDAVWTCGLSVGHINLSMAVFILIYRSHPYRWTAVVPRSNYLILAVEPYDSYAQDRIRHCVEPSGGLAARLYVFHAVSHGFGKKIFPFPPSFLPPSVSIKF